MTVRIRKNSLLEDLYLKSDGTWGTWKEARRCANQERATRFAAKCGIEIYGLFEYKVFK
jgi:hypothetical protein